MRNHLKTSLGICKWGNGHNWIWAKLLLVELSQVTPTRGVDDLQLILVETATIEYGRNCRWSSCPWTKLPWVELSLDEIAVGRVVLGRNCRGSRCHWTKLPWVELFLDEIAMGRVVLSELINFQREDDQYL